MRGIIVCAVLVCTACSGASSVVAPERAVLRKDLIKTRPVEPVEDAVLRPDLIKTRPAEPIRCDTVWPVSAETTIVPACTW